MARTSDNGGAGTGFAALLAKYDDTAHEVIGLFKGERNYTDLQELFRNYYEANPGTDASPSTVAEMMDRSKIVVRTGNRFRLLVYSPEVLSNAVKAVATSAKSSAMPVGSFYMARREAFERMGFRTPEELAQILAKYNPKSVSGGIVSPLGFRGGLVPRERRRLHAERPVAPEAPAAEEEAAVKPTVEERMAARRRSVRGDEDIEGWLRDAMPEFAGRFTADRAVTVLSKMMERRPDRDAVESALDHMVEAGELTSIGESVYRKVKPADASAE